MLVNWNPGQNQTHWPTSHVHRTTAWVTQFRDSIKVTARARVMALLISTVFNSVFMLITNKTPQLSISYPLSWESTEVMFSISSVPSQIAKFTGTTWGPPGSCRPQMGPMLATWTLLSGLWFCFSWHEWRYRRDLSDLFKFYFQKLLRLFQIKHMPL